MHILLSVFEFLILTTDVKYAVRTDLTLLVSVWVI